jgi:hypothetical protein
LTVGADSAEFDCVLHRGKSGVEGDPSGPLLDDLGVHRPAAAAGAADQVVAVAARPPPVQPFAGGGLDDIDRVRGLQIEM